MDGTRRQQGITRVLGLALGALVLLNPAAGARGQIISGAPPLAPHAPAPSFLTVSVPSGGSMDFALISGAPANGSNPAVIATSWSVNPGQVGTIGLYGYFTTPTAALVGPGYSIAASYVEGRVPTGLPTVYTPFTESNPVGPAGGSLCFFSEVITGLNKDKSRTDNLDVRINLTTSPPVPLGTYTGTIRIQAWAF
jgi:hypothetical protein